MDTRDQYDLIVIGSGPAGEKGAAQAAYFGRKVLLIEKEPSCGGAAANTGTLPSKTLRETSLMLSGLKARDLYGVDLSMRREATVQDFLHRERQVVDLERWRIDKNLKRHKIELCRGLASFIDAHTIKIQPDNGDPYQVRGEIVLVATGSRPRLPDIFPFADHRVFCSDTVLQIDQLPERMAVVGAGVIGSEYACTFAALGIEVTLLNNRAVIMGFLDPEISTALKQGMWNLGIKTMMPVSVNGCRALESHIEVEYDDGQMIETDAVLVAAGRCSNTPSLNLENAGITPGRRGLIEVDEWYQTSVSNIYAAGDVVGFPALASTSMEQARLAMCHAFDLDYKKEVASLLPFGIFTIPEVSMVGETELSLSDAGVDYVVGQALYSGNARGVIIGDKDGFLKLIFRRPDLKLVGVHVIGEIASEIVHTGMMAMHANATAELFIRACFNYPTLGQLYKYATYDALGRINAEQGQGL